MSFLSRSPDHSASAVNSLYCVEDASEVVQWDADASIFDLPQSTFIGYSPPCDENTIIRLIDSESQFLPSSDYLHRCLHGSVDTTVRQDSINWILKVHGYYDFKPVTAYLSVNYFDRFLSSNSLLANGWPFQLLSVVCLSLAAKMEELHVPLLVDFQILEPAFIFESKTIQRMELWVMANLDWRLRSVTPFDYLDYFIDRLRHCSFPKPDNFNRIFKSSSDLILRTIRVIDFMGLAPSTIAAAAVLCAAGCGAESFDKSVADGDLFHERVNKEMVRSCRQLMEEYLVDTRPWAPLKKLTVAPPAVPPSPVAVLDAAAACGSCDTRSENPGSTSRAEDVEPLAKRLRSSAPDVQET